jgi:hypothetical protein
MYLAKSPGRGFGSNSRTSRLDESGSRVPQRQIVHSKATPRNPNGESGHNSGSVQDSPRPCKRKRKEYPGQDSTDHHPSHKRTKTESTNGGSLDVPTPSTLLVNIPAFTFYNNTGRINEGEEHRRERLSESIEKVSECTRFVPSQDTLSKLGVHVVVRVYCDMKDHRKRDANFGMQESMNAKEKKNYYPYQYDCCAYRGLEEEFRTRPTKELVPLETTTFPPLTHWGKEKEVTFFSARVEDLQPTEKVEPIKDRTVHCKSIVYISTDSLGDMERFLVSWNPYHQAEPIEQQHCVGVGFVHVRELWKLWHPTATVPSHHSG